MSTSLAQPVPARPTVPASDPAARRRVRRAVVRERLTLASDALAFADLLLGVNLSTSSLAGRAEGDPGGGAP